MSCSHQNLAPDHIPHRSPAPDRSGAWFLLELGKTSMWFGYALAVTLVTFYLLSSPPHNDTVMSVYMWASQAWDRCEARPVVNLDDAYFSRFEDFVARVPEIPSLVGCRSFTVRGNAEIPAGYVAEGDAVIAGN